MKLDKGKRKMPFSKNIQFTVKTLHRMAIIFHKQSINTILEIIKNYLEFRIRESHDVGYKKRIYRRRELNEMNEQ